MADPKKGPGGLGRPLVLDQSEARRATKTFFWRPAPPPPPPSKNLDDLDPPYLKVWIRHCYLPPKLLQYVTYAVTLRSHGRAEAGGHKEEHILFLKVH